MANLRLCAPRIDDQVEQDATRDFWLTATEAVEYGIIDEVVITKKRG